MKKLRKHVYRYFGIVMGIAGVLGNIYLENLDAAWWAGMFSLMCIADIFDSITNELRDRRIKDLEEAARWALILVTDWVPTQYFDMLEYISAKQAVDPNGKFDWQDPRASKVNRKIKELTGPVIFLDGQEISLTAEDARKVFKECEHRIIRDDRSPDRWGPQNILQIKYEDEWRSVARTDLYDDIATGVIPLPSNAFDYYLEKISLGARVGEYSDGRKFFHVIDAYTDG
jgi:hypothetical protein